MGNTVHCLLWSQNYIIVCEHFMKQVLNLETANVGSTEVEFKLNFSSMMSCIYCSTFLNFLESDLNIPTVVPSFSNFCWPLRMLNASVTPQCQVRCKVRKLSDAYLKLMQKRQKQQNLGILPYGQHSCIACENLKHLQLTRLHVYLTHCYQDNTHKAC